jgi:curved DNA-binding protein CbpA
MRLHQGLFKLDFNDYYAVLGLPLDADAKVVRKRYLHIARKLHPDSMAGISAGDVQKASETLSKLVNPAYETLGQDKTSSEYQVVLKLRGQTLRQASAAPEVETAAAQKLLKTPQVETDYHRAVRALAQEQYDHLDALEATIGQLSELNLVYLYRTVSGDGSGSGSSSRPPTATPQERKTTTQAETTPPQPRRVRDRILESYINRTQDFERSKDYGRAILELREALKTYPNSGVCHSYLASIYLKSGQATMAKIHAKRALEINPSDDNAKAVQARVQRSTGTSTKPADADKGGSKTNTGGKGGGFFGLFGGKKK